MKPQIKVKPPGPKAREIIQRDASVTSRCLSRAYGLVIARAFGANFEDVDGNVFIDFTSGIGVTNVGHSNPKVSSAIKEQLERGTHGAFFEFHSELPVRFSEALIGLLPKGFKKVFLCNSGTESIEAAMKLSRYATGRPYYISFHGAFHGQTYGSLSLTASRPVHKERFGPYMPVVHVPYAYCYRCPFADDENGCCQQALAYIEKVFQKGVPPDDVAAIFSEPVQGEGGYILPPLDFIKGLRKICDDRGILYVDDEVQAGGFRSGRFLAIEHFGVEPDVICMANSIGGGLPLGATAWREELDLWRPGSHGNTFGGNLLACASGLAALEVMKERGFGEEVHTKGRFAMKRLKAMMEDHELIGDVRGLGLMIGVELVKERRTKEPAIEERDRLVRLAFERGLCLLPGGESCVRIAPPLTIDREDLEAGLDILEGCFETIKSETLD